MKKLSAAARITEIDTFSDSVIRFYTADSGVQQDTYLKTVMDEIKTLSAELTSAILSKYKKITAASYAQGSSLIESLLDDLNAPGAKAAVAELDGVEEIIAAVRKAQDDFNAANDEYVKSAGAKSASATSVKKQLVLAVNEKFIPCLTAMILANPVTFAPFATNVETELTRVNETVQKRGK